MVDHFLVNWRTTVCGAAHSVNWLAMGASALHAHHTHTQIPHEAYLVWLFTGAALHFCSGALAKDAARGSDRPQQIADKKLDMIPPIDSGHTIGIDPIEDLHKLPPDGPPQ